jgi:predicted alpha/beta hydrolase family esterase
MVGRVSLADEVSTRSAIRVLLATGIETGPHDSKAGVLAAEFHALCVPDMRVSVWQLWKRNCLLRCALCPNSAMHLLWLLLFASAVLVLAGGAHRPVIRACAALVAGAALPRLVQEGVGAAFAASLEVQRSELRRFKPHVAVGCSWGGAVLLALRESGEWSGPLVLVAPARALVARCLPRRPTLGGLASGPTDVARAADRSILVIHGDDDPIVPLRDSVELCSREGYRLLVVPSGGHRCTAALETRGESGMTASGRRRGAARSLLAQLVLDASTGTRSLVT